MKKCELELKELGRDTKDLKALKKPFLRIARPFKIEDNIGLHKDTIYGQSPYEMSIHVPLMSLGNKSCLKFAKNIPAR